jgi:SAM-dependent methyltransferase
VPARDDGPSVKAAGLLAWLASLPPAERDAAIEARLGIAAPATPSIAPGDHLIGYHASGIAPIVRMLIEVPVTVEDVVVDLGAGLGKVLLLTRILTGATTAGIEVQAALVERGRQAAERNGVEVAFTHGDAREAEIDHGTAFFLYLPFTGPVLADVLRRLHGVASRRAIVVGSLGVDLEREAPWLVRRPIDSFWLTIYDSAVPGVPRRTARARSPLLGLAAEAIAFERLMA